MAKRAKSLEKEDVEKYFKSRLIPAALRAAEDTLAGDDNANRQKTVDSILDRAGIVKKEVAGPKTQVTFNIPPEYLQNALETVTKMVEANNDSDETVDDEGVGSD